MAEAHEIRHDKAAEGELGGRHLLQEALGTNIDEAVRLKTGGRSRLTRVPERVQTEEEHFTDIVDHGCMFTPPSAT